jgi:sterol 3beta-glucosyltransferase
VNTAIQSIYRDLEYAKSLVAAKAGKNAATVGSTDGANAGDESEEESWTFVGGDEVDPELIVKKSILTEIEASIKAGGSGFGFRPLDTGTSKTVTPTSKS